MGGKKNLSYLMALLCASEAGLTYMHTHTHTLTRKHEGPHPPCTPDPWPQQPPSLSYFRCLLFLITPSSPHPLNVCAPTNVGRGQMV